jgi:DNA-binding XRE family transcriptional regulator
MKTKGEKKFAGRSRRPAESPLPPLPGPNAEGLYPALETIDIIIARNIGKRRRQARLSQADLAARAGIRQETVSRIETGKHSSTLRTIEKIAGPSGGWGVK